MGYCHIELSPNSKRMCTIVLSWGKCEYQKIPMGLCNSLDVFQEKMSGLFQDLVNVRAYIDDLLILTTCMWNAHLQQSKTVLMRLQKVGLKINAKKSLFGRHELEYLGYRITCKGMMPMSKKVEAMTNIATPTTNVERNPVALLQA